MPARIKCANQACSNTCTETTNDGWVTIVIYVMATGADTIHRYLCRACGRHYRSLLQ
jgi:hypothetical protein